MNPSPHHRQCRTALTMTMTTERNTSREVQWYYAVNSSGASKFELLWKQRDSDTSGSGPYSGGGSNRRFQFVKCVGAAINTTRGNGQFSSGRINAITGGTFVNLKSIREALESSSAQYRRREALPKESESLDLNNDRQVRQIDQKPSDFIGMTGNDGGAKIHSSSNSSRASAPHSHKSNEFIGGHNEARKSSSIPAPSAMNVSNSYKTPLDFLPTQDPEHAFDYGESWGDPTPSMLPQQQQLHAPTTLSNQYTDSSQFLPLTVSGRNANHNNTDNNGSAQLFEDEDEFETSVDDELAALDVETIVATKPYDEMSSSYHLLSNRVPLRAMNGEPQYQNSNAHHRNFQGNSYSSNNFNTYGGNNGNSYRETQEKSKLGIASGGGGATFGECYDRNFCQYNRSQSNNHNEGYNNTSNHAYGEFNDVFGGTNDRAPVCPGHGKPCRVLTAQTQNNLGRQFYKCSMPDEEQCDFFEWVDGNSGNALDGTCISYGQAMGSSGETKDVYTEVRRVFGHTDFRPGQKDVIKNAMLGRDVFVLMPTGGGKSLCYQLPAWCCPGISVVVSPLLSLIEDQVQSMTKLGVESVFLNSMQAWEGEQQTIINKLRSPPAHGGIKLLYITPEKLSHSSMIKGIFKSLSERGLISRFVVDEAHCLSDW